MNTAETKKLTKANGVVALKADKTEPVEEIDDLLQELGNAAGSIPYLVIFPADGGRPLILEGTISQADVLAALQKAGPSKVAPTVSTAAKR